MLLPLGIDDPDRAVLLNRAGQRFHARQDFQILSAKNDQIRIARCLLALEIRNALSKVFQENRVLDAENNDSLAWFDAELIEQQPMRIIAFRRARLSAFLVRHSSSSLRKEAGL